ncbi:MAG: hypothetical protein JNK95_06100 [Candidatus Competibacter sp.]|nr:hypothetical protein [Candidatus Competibacter sp.]HRD50143.1 hypothetical protein [Candidatus Contendobacter sp.]
MEERIGDVRLGRYGEVFRGKSVTSMNDLQGLHGNYAIRHLEIDPSEADIPDTFAADNAANAWRHIDDRLYLLRIEDVGFALRGSTIDITELERAVKAHDNAVLERFCDLWDDRRDRRPAFATTEIAVDDILKDAGDEWPNALRDFLGLGSYNPEPHVDPIPVLLMRYTVAEVLADKSSGAPGFAIPTLIDGWINPFFFPTPQPAPNSTAAQYEVGRSVNLHPATTQTEYRMGMELVHSRIAYTPEHIWRLGRVSRPLAGDLAILRGLHLAWLQLEADRADFGAP